MCSLSQLLKIRLAASSAYHPQMDGHTEQVNQEVKQFLRLFVNQWQDNCDEWLAIAKFAYNDQIHTLTQSSPFMLNTGKHPWISVELLRESHLETLNNFTPGWERPQMKHIQP